MTSAAALRTELNEALGEEIFFAGTDQRFETKLIPTGVMPIDDLLQGGVPRGRWTSLLGDYSTLKSYIAYSTIAQAQQLGLKVALIDTEHVYDPEWLEHLGVDVDQLLIAQPATAELAVDATQTCIHDDYGLVVWDSVSAMAPQDEVGKREHNETAQPARLAALLSRGLRKLTAANRHTAVLTTNQTRNNIGMRFGPKLTAPGGRALPFYDSHRVNLRRTTREYAEGFRFEAGKLTKIRKITGTNVIAELEKSKLTAPNDSVAFTFSNEIGGIDVTGYLFGKGVLAGVITDAGKGWWQLPDSPKKQRLKAVRKAIEDDQALFDRLAAL